MSSCMFGSGVHPTPAPGHTGTRVVGASTDYRFLSISLLSEDQFATRGQGASVNALISRLGHELQHVLEVVAAPDVQSQQSLQTLYERIGFAVHVGVGTSRRYETFNAQEAEQRVWRELR